MSKDKDYTVVLQRPDYMADPYGLDVYVFIGKAKSQPDALRKAQKEAFDADTKGGGEPDDPDDYALVVGFDGICTPTMFSWSL